MAYQKGVDTRVGDLLVGGVYKVTRGGISLGMPIKRGTIVEVRVEGNADVMFPVGGVVIRVGPDGRAISPETVLRVRPL